MHPSDFSEAEVNGLIHVLRAALHRQAQFHVPQGVARHLSSALQRLGGRPGPPKPKKNRRQKNIPRSQSLEPGTTYESRNKNLLTLGFKTYEEYLNSPVWRRIRRRVYGTKGTTCHLCPKPATELHHNRYHADDLSGAVLHNIVPLCRDCHQSIEFDGSRKCSIEEAATNYRRRRHDWKPTATLNQNEARIKEFVERINADPAMIYKTRTKKSGRPLFDSPWCNKPKVPS